jgi:hypothetical protein
MDRETYGLLNGAASSISELLELLKDHPRTDILSRAAFVSRECMDATSKALLARIHEDSARNRERNGLTTEQLEN